MSLDATRWAWMQVVRSSSAKLVLLSIADRADERHTAYPSIDRLHQDTELDRKTVMSAVEHLEKNGFLVADRGNGRRTTYQLLGVDGREKAQDERRSQARKDRKTSPENGTGTKSGTGTENGTGPVPNPVPVPDSAPVPNPVPRPVPILVLEPVPNLGHEPTKEPTSNRPRGERAPAGLDFSILPQDLDPSLLDDFLKMRRNNKCPVCTQTTVKGLARELEAGRAQGLSPDTMIRVAIEKNWRGLKPQWVKNALAEDLNTKTHGTRHGYSGRRPSSAELNEANRKALDAFVRGDPIQESGGLLIQGEFERC